jgi:hypothetical protein
MPKNVKPVVTTPEVAEELEETKPASAKEPEEGTM